MSADKIYDFEGIVEPAIASVMTSLGIEPYTTQGDPAFQKKRARCEIKYVHGSGMGRFVVVINGQNAALHPELLAGVSSQQQYYNRRESAWACSIRFALVTAADPVTHAQWRAAMRSALAQVWLLINPTLTRHTLQMIRDGGNTEPMLSPETGLMRTDFTFDGTLSVNADAWDVLAQP